MRQDLGVGAPLLRHDVGAVLAHAHAVSVAGSREAKDPVGKLDREGRRAQTEQSADLRAREDDRTDTDRFDAPAFIVLRRSEPLRRVLRKDAVWVRLQHRALQGFREMSASTT